jgi:hypothetical protein
MAQPMPIPAFAPVERSELPLDAVIEVGVEVSNPTVLVVELVIMLEKLEVADCEVELVRELHVGAYVVIVAPEEPNLRISVFNET